MTDHREIAPNEDPVCGMTPDIEASRAKSLVLTYGDREFVFCGKGCLLEFRDDPERFLAPDYQPSM
jgi:YHS domain-containing protein